MKMITSSDSTKPKKKNDGSSISSRAKSLKKCYPVPLSPVWVLHERLDLDMVKACLDPVKGLPLNHRDRDVLECILEDTDEESKFLLVEYYHSKNRQSGRVYASISLQRLSSKVRNLCIPDDGKSIDVDIANAHPEILCQVFQKHNIHAPVLQKYITDRDEIISKILKQFPNLTREDVKKAFITAQNQGCYKRHATGGQEIEFLDEFTAELKRAASELYKLDTYSDIREHVETGTYNEERDKNKKKSKNLLGGFIFHVCEDVEIQLVTVARNTLKQSGFVTRVNMYDGLIVEPLWRKQQEQPLRLDLDKLNEAVTQATGYVVRFVIKPIVRSTIEAYGADHEIEPNDKLILFGLEGTLMYKGVVRPGAKEQLCLLKTGGSKIGLFTDQPRRLLDLDRLQKELCLEFEVVLTNEHCYYSSSSTELEAHTKETDHQKKSITISHYFPDNLDVVCIDTKPERVAKKDRDKVLKMPMWTGEREEEDVLGNAINRATSEVFASRGILSYATNETQHRVQQVLAHLDVNSRKRRVHVLQSSYPLMGQDPRFDARSEEGKQIVREWGKLVMYKGHIGAGKTWCVNTAVIEWARQNKGKKAVYIVPFRNLSREQTANLRAVAAESRGTGKALRIHFYREGLSDSVPWDILVACPMSLYKFNVADAELFAIDEVSAFGTQLMGWTDKEGNVTMRLDQAIDIIKFVLHKNPQSTILLCGAQADKFEQERILALLEIDPSVDMLKYEHSGTCPVIPVARLKSKEHAINYMWHYFMKGDRVAIHFRHATDASVAGKYCTLKAEQCGVQAPRFLEWTQQALAKYKARPHPSEGVTMYLQATQPQIMAYTTALNPGMSVDGNLFDRRIMTECNTGSGAGPKVTGQMPGRMRMVKDPTVLLHASDSYEDEPNWCSSSSSSSSSSKSSSSKSIEEIIHDRLAALPGADVETVIGSDGMPVCRLKAGLRNDLRLEAAVFAAKGVTFDGIRKQMGDTRLIATPTDVSSEVDPLLLQVYQERKYNLDSYIEHYNDSELLLMRAHTKKVYADVLDKSERIISIAKMLPRKFVTAGTEWVQPHGQRLSNKAFNLVNTMFYQFVNMQLFIWRLCKATGQEAERTWGFVSQVARERQMATIDLLADTDVTVLAIDHLCTLLSLAPTSVTTIQVYKPDSHAVTVSHNWLTSNWQKVKSLSSRHAKMPDTPPSRGNIRDWEQCLKRVLKEQLGVGIKKQRDQKKKKRKKTDTPSATSCYALTAGSIWKILGVDLPSYIQWLCGTEPEMTVVSPTVYVRCDLCEIDGGLVECVFQGGVARCVLKPSLHVDEHRDLKMPLDVGLAKEFEQRVIQRNTEVISVPSNKNLLAPPVFLLLGEKKEEEEEEGATRRKSELADVLLRFMGFIDGTGTTQSVCTEDVLSAIANNTPITASDQLQIKDILGLSVSTMLQWDNAKKITVALRTLAKVSAAFTIVNKRAKKGMDRTQMYTITLIL
jgi:hypothetical protein